MYKIEKNGAMWVVLTTSGNVIQFQSTKRANCKDWLRLAGQEK